MKKVIDCIQRIVLWTIWGGVVACAAFLLWAVFALSDDEPHGTSLSSVSPEISEQAAEMRLLDEIARESEHPDSSR